MRLFFLLILLTVFIVPLPVLAITDAKNFDLNLEVTTCNNNGICESGLGETVANCATDCTLPVCNNNGVCDSGENSTNCSHDCLVISGGSGGSYSIPPSIVVPPSIVIPSSSISATTTALVTTTIITPIAIFSNVFNLRAEADDSIVRLSWKNPPDNTGYVGVLIRRSISFFPTSITSGGLLYKGVGTNLGSGQYEYVDTGLKNGQRYFYTVFAYNIKNEYTSGASVSALPQSAEQKKGVKELLIPPQELPPEIGLPLIPTPIGAQPIYFGDFSFVQENKILNSVDNEIQSQIAKPLVIYLDSNKVPNQTDSIILTTQDISQENALPSSFLFRKDSKTGRYILVLPAQPNVGRIKTTITFIDKNLVAIRRLTGFIEVYSGSLIKPVTTSTVQIIRKPSAVVKVQSLLMLLKDFIVQNWLSSLIFVTISLLILLLKYLRSGSK